MLFRIKFIEKCAWKKVFWTESWGSVTKPNDQNLDNESEVRNFRNTKSFSSSMNWTLKGIKFEKPTNENVCYENKLNHSWLWYVAHSASC